MITYTLDHPELAASEPATIEKVAIVVSKGSLEGIYPALIMANGSAHGRDRGRPLLHVLRPRRDPKDRFEKIKVATVGNPGLHMPTWLGALPGFSGLATKMMQRQMEKIDIPPIPEFIELVADSGVRLYRVQGDGGPVRADDGRLRPPGREHHQRRRVLREGGRRPDRLHLAVAEYPQQNAADIPRAGAGCSRRSETCVDLASGWSRQPQTKETNDGIASRFRAQAPRNRFRRLLQGRPRSCSGLRSRSSASWLSCCGPTPGTPATRRTVLRRRPPSPLRLITTSRFRWPVSPGSSPRMPGSGRGAQGV